MIKQIRKWAIDPSLLSYLTFQTLNKETNILIEDGYSYIEETSYYPIIEPYLTYKAQSDFNFQRCVNLDYVKECLTELGDDLTKYGFVCIGYENDGQLWQKN